MLKKILNALKKILPKLNYWIDFYPGTPSRNKTTMIKKITKTKKMKKRRKRKKKKKKMR